MPTGVSRATAFLPDRWRIALLRDPYNLVGRTIVEKYHVKALIGIGGMGVVYNAQHLSLDRRVAIKILQPNIALKNLHTLDLFQKEAKLAARSFHENIISILDAGRTADDIAYMVMEWLDGRLLKKNYALQGRSAQNVRENSSADSRRPQKQKCPAHCPPRPQTGKYNAHQAVGRTRCR